MLNSPESVLDFWLGSLRSIEDTSEDNWRERMLRWRVGVFARNFVDIDFNETQREVCEEIHRVGYEAFFQPDDKWETPHGWLAQLIILDQFGRSVYRGTPEAYANDALTDPILRRICGEGWDTQVYNEVERMWVYVALSHPETEDLQELSVAKWMQWSTDLVSASPEAYRNVNKRVSWFFVRSVIEHSEAVLVHNRFPHRNAIMCRDHKPSDLFYLTSELRPLWSFTQPPWPAYYALHAAYHRACPAGDCTCIDRDELESLHHYFGLDTHGGANLMDVFDVIGTERISFRDLFRHAALTEKRDVMKAIEANLAGEALFKQVHYAIFKDPDTQWPPRSAKTSVPKIIDVPSLLQAIQCPHLSKGDLRLSAAAIDNFRQQTAFRPCPFAELLADYRIIRQASLEPVEMKRDGAYRSHSLTKKEFSQIAEHLFGESDRRADIIATIYRLLDVDYSGRLDGAEVLVALSALCTGSLKEKLAAAFEAFDESDSNTLDCDEARSLVHSMLMRGLHLVESLFDEYAPAEDDSEKIRVFSSYDFASIERTANRALYEADADGDGLINQHEFIKWATDHPMLRDFFGLHDKLFRRVRQPA